MATEIFLQPELEELVIDASKKDEWTSKIVELNLEGQMKLTANSDKASASPYTFINEQMKLVFETICPTKSVVEKYDKSVIPIDVLSHVALCKQEQYFHKLEIWFDNKSPDPILVGYITKEYNSPLHLIARWGDEIVPYEQLVEKAINRYTQAFKLAVMETKAKCESALSGADVHIRQLFAGQKGTWEIQPSFNMRTTNIDLPF